MANNTLFVKIKTDLKEFSTGLQNMERQLKSFSRKTEKIGKDLSTAISLPIIGLGVMSVKNFGESEEALAGLQAQLRSSGKDVILLTAKYEKFAEQIMKMTKVDDDAVIGLVQMAETMKSINPEEAVKGAIALNKALGVDMEAAMKMAVNAQNGQYTALQRMVPALRVAKTEAEKAAIVQQLFADGMAIANEEAGRGTGPLIQLKNELQNLSESMGAIVLKSITPFIEKIKQIGERFAEMSPKFGFFNRWID